VAQAMGRLVHKESGIDELMGWVRRELRQRERLVRAIGAEVASSRSATGRSGTRKRLL